MSVFQSCAVEYGGRQFSSVREFAEFYGLEYSSASRLLRKGRSPGEVISRCRYTQSCVRGEKGSRRSSSACSWMGVSYGSLHEAAVCLGYRPNQLYELRRRWGLTPDETLAMAADLAARHRGFEPGSPIPCEVGGVCYGSREEACRALDIPSATVYSRMRRECIPFEEALIRGRMEKLYVQPVQSLSLRADPGEAEEVPEQELLDTLYNALTYYRFQVERRLDRTTGQPLLLAEGVTCIGYNQEASGLEIWTAFPFQMDACAVNLVNRSFAGCKLAWDEEDRAVLLTFQTVKAENQEIRTVLTSFFSHISCRDILMRQYAA